MIRIRARVTADAGSRCFGVLRFRRAKGIDHFSSCLSSLLTSATERRLATKQTLHHDPRAAEPQAKQQKLFHRIGPEFAEFLKKDSFLGVLRASAVSSFVGRDCID
ncbi:MAG: hypothetical protein ACRD43_01135, partial [Pyrinomonadaceae bacterium]